MTDDPACAIGAVPETGNPAVVSGDPGISFETLVARYSVELYRYAWRLTRNRDEADDLYQETMLRAWRAFERSDRELNYRPWLYRICTNTFLSAKRRDKRMESLDQHAPIAAPMPDLAAQLDARALLEALEHLVAELPTKQRFALVLRKFHQLDYAEIADALQCSESAARANVYQALRKLRQSLGAQLDVRD